MVCDFSDMTSYSVNLYSFKVGEPQNKTLLALSADLPSTQEWQTVRNDQNCRLTISVQRLNDVSYIQVWRNGFQLDKVDLSRPTGYTVIAEFPHIAVKYLLDIESPGLPITKARMKNFQVRFRFHRDFSEFIAQLEQVCNVRTSARKLDDHILDSSNIDAEYLTKLAKDPSFWKLVDIIDKIWTTKERSDCREEQEHFIRPT